MAPFAVMIDGGVRKAKRDLRLDFLLLGALMVVFGFTEVITGFRHEFLGISTAANTLSTALGAGLGVVYALSGVLTLTRKRAAVTAAILLLSADVVGRILMTVGGLFPLDTTEQVVSITLGTAIAGAFAVYLGIKRQGLSN